MSKTINIKTPFEHYELVDFGGGRVLERYGQMLVERPVSDDAGQRRLDDWTPDWRYTAFAAISEWRPQREALPSEWTQPCFSSSFGLRLFDKGHLSLDPEHFACAQWLDQRLSGCYDMQDLRVLCLFGGAGVVSAAALKTGASVTHVEPRPELMEAARSFLGDSDIEYIYDDPHNYVDQALRQQQKFDLIVILPPVLYKGEHKRSWDIKCDLGPMMVKIPRLLNAPFRGVWLAPQMQQWQADSLLPFVREILPGRCIDDVQIKIETADGRQLQGGIAVYAYDEDELPGLDGQRPQLVAENIESRLDVYLDPVLSSRRTAAAPARALAAFSREQQEFVLHWVEVLARTNAEMAYQFARYVPAALQGLPLDEVRAWLLDATDAYDTTGLHAGIAVLKEVEAYVERVETGQSAIELATINNVLMLFVHGLNGRQLKVDEGQQVYTDTDTVFLPRLLNQFGERELNFLLYKAMLVHQWSLTWWGSFQADLQPLLTEYADTAKLLNVFHRLEVIRLDARIRRTLPGMHRVLQQLRDMRQQSLLPAHWPAAVAAALQGGASVCDSLKLVPACYVLDEPDPLCYQGELNLAAVERARQARILKDKQVLQSMLFKLQDDSAAALELSPEAEAGRDRQLQINVRQHQELDELVVELTLDGQPLTPPADVADVISSIYQDLGEIPPEYLVAAGDGAYHMDRSDGDRSRDVWKGNYHEEGACLYDEWDFKRQSYRKNWCVLREVDVRKQSTDFVSQTLLKHKGLVHEIRRTFEILRGEDKLLKKQPYGDDIDVDAVVEAIGDVSSGLEMSERLFTKKHKLERNIAVMFMVDMSGSTKGWINDAERESLVLLCEALEILGDRYAIYGFSGMTRKRCELYRVKHFDEPYDDEIRARISGISPQDYTRMGVTIRHLTGLLKEVEARTKLLITLSDGKPDDFDGYRSEYGIEDTRRALIEAKREGIHPFCITIDSEGPDYLPHMYGAVNYVVIDDVRKLPLRVSDIYRKLTT